MNANEQKTFHLPAGQVLTVVASSGASGSAVRMSTAPGGGDPQSITAITTGSASTFGPYAQTERFNIICAAGTLTITETVPDPSLGATDAELAALLALKANLASPVFTGTTSFEKALIPSATPPVNAVAASGTLTVSAGGSNIQADETVTIGDKVYTFKSALTPTEGEVLIGANDTAALLNLKNAINHEGTPGTDYSCAAAHSTVSASSSNATTVVVAAKTKGTAGNAIATTETMANGSWGAATLASGVNGTVGAAREIYVDASYLYLCSAANTIADANWRRISLGTAY